MPLSDLLSADRITLLSEPGNRETVLDAAARLLADGSPSHTELIADSLRQRERLGSTAIGHGVAIPHGRNKAYGQVRAAFLRLTHPVDFASSDGEPIDLVFAMSVPEHFTQEHLQWLAELAERFANPEFRDALRTARDLEALRTLMLVAPPAAAA